MTTKILDVCGMKCPVPIVKAKQALDQLSSGDVLEVRATDPGSVQDFQGWAKTHKHAVLKEQRTETDDAGRSVFVHVLERRG
jgi:TusA-related sulfurtransferase